MKAQPGHLSSAGLNLKQSDQVRECVACCIRWLKQMTREEMKYNAPMIEMVAGVEQMEKVRQAFKESR